MNFLYEENLQENPFFVKIMESHNSLINEAGISDWIIVIPKISQISKESCQDHEFLLSHVLVASDDLPKTHFTSLIGVDITINEKYLHIKDGVNSRRSLILFEEMFYTKEMQKFKILCIETPLCHKFLQKTTAASNLVSNVAESIAVISQSSPKGMRKIDNAISNFNLRIQKTSDYPKLKTNVKLLYDYCINLICPKKIKILDPFLSMNLKIALEYYLMDTVYDKLFNAISNHFIEENQKFNKILRKLASISIEDLNIAPTKIHENLNVMRMELAKISSCKCSLDKLYCIKNAIDAISSTDGDKLMATDELLPTLVFAIIKTNFFHWIPTLIFIKEFNLSQLLSPENQSAGSVMFYILTTLEAVIFFIETNENLPMKSQQLLVAKKVDDITSPDDYMQHLFQYVKDDNEIQLLQLINVKYTSFISRSPTDSSEDTSLCHPLCTCSSCKFIIEESDSNVNVKATNDLTMMHIAAAFNVPKMVTILMNFGADVDCKDSNGWSALHYSAHRGHQKVLFLLLHGKSTINSITNLKQTPLLLAAMNGHDCCVKALLYFADHTCMSLDLNAQDFEGNTALIYATQAGFESIVDGLLEYRAKVSVKNNIGKIAADYAFNTAIKIKLESALKYQAEELPVNEQEYVFISNEDLADVC